MESSVLRSVELSDLAVEPLEPLSELAVETLEPLSDVPVEALEPAPAGSRIAEVPAQAPPVGVPAPSPTSVEVVLVTRDERDQLARSLPAIRRAAAAAGAELLIVDLGSTDGTRRFVAKQAWGARGIALGRSDRLAEALSAAVAASEAEVLVVLSPSLQPSSENVIGQLVEHLDCHPYAAVAAPAVHDADGRVVGSAGVIPIASTLLAAGARRAGEWASRSLELARTRRGSSDRFARVEWVAGAAFAVRRADLESVGGFDERLSGVTADLDFGIRLRRRGRELHYVPAVEVQDIGGGLAAEAGPVSRPDALRLFLSNPRFMWRPSLTRCRSAVALSSRLLRRAIDIVASTLLLVLSAPLLLAIAAAIRLDSPGSSLFRQRRLGQNAEPFQMFKFRTMRVDADEQLHQRFVHVMIVNRWRADCASSSPHLDRPDEGACAQVFKLHPDPRVTRVGRMLRRTSLDELPQLFNVLRGDMTLVGFRAPIPYELNHYPAWYYRRFDEKPGLTGLWQVSGRNERSYEEMVSLDIEYLNRRTWLTDLGLLARTIGVVLTGRGAY
jgi:lipopolysaccharide/colanic/teichoic acid biosynthesis glycosyltransferase/GT2 family glycosyltransferase